MKKLLSFLIIITLIAGISAFGASAESQHGFYIPGDPDIVGSETHGFTNPDGWEQVYAYAYNDYPNWYGATENAPYPGVPATYEYVKGYGNIYTISFASGAFKYVTFNDGTGEAPKLEFWKEDVLDAAGIGTAYSCEVLGYEELYEYGGNFNVDPDYVLVRLCTDMFTPSPVADALGEDYIIRQTSAGIPFSYDYGIYLPRQDRVMDIAEAFEEGIEGIENVLPYISSKELVGDVNRDDELNILDATVIQKQLAGLITIENDSLDEYRDAPVGAISDFDRDGKCTVKDATTIQKKLAGLLPSTPEEILPPVTPDEPLLPTTPTDPEEILPSDPEETLPSEPEETLPSDPEETLPSEPEETLPSEPEETLPTEPEIIDLPTYIEFDLIAECRVEYAPNEDGSFYIANSPEDIASIYEIIGESDWYPLPDLTDICDDAFFEENALIISTAFVGGSCCSQHIYGIYRFNHHLDILRSVSRHENCTPDMNYQCVILSVLKKDIKNVSGISFVSDYDY
ncbi:MAG: hypothetical protein IJD19_06385 [Ruminococcus sp.]|nr:hypothetical protein [Ruminococcus sp.]